MTIVDSRYFSQLEEDFIVKIKHSDYLILKKEIKELNEKYRDLLHRHIEMRDGTMSLLKELTMEDIAVHLLSNEEEVRNMIQKELERREGKRI